VQKLQNYGYFVMHGVFDSARRYDRYALSKAIELVPNKKIAFENLSYDFQARRLNRRGSLVDEINTVCECWDDVIDGVIMMQQWM
jgi:hypothetical protein